ncbi:hypothetical protein PN499_15660 [Kamptonema animale CS-326]|nr:hypothetical protein [Kamptonema animale CS-326]
MRLQQLFVVNICAAHVVEPEFLAVSEVGSRIGLVLARHGNF